MVKSKKTATRTKQPLCWHAVPLKSSFMLSAILGFLISAYYVYPQSKNYGLAFMVVFTAMFVAAIISMTKAPVPDKGWEQ